MPIIAKAAGKKFTFPDGTTQEQMGMVIDEFFAKESQSIAPQQKVQAVEEMSQPLTAPEQQQEPGFLSRISEIPGAIGEAITGTQRATEETQRLPELGALIGRAQEQQTAQARQGFAPQELQAFKARAEQEGLSKALKDIEASAGQQGLAKVGAGLLSSFDENEQIQIIKQNIPNAEIRKDEKGNTIVRVGESEAVLNKPGFSRQDFSQAASNILAFLGPSKLTSLARSLAGRVGLGAAGAGATQAAIEAGQEKIGGEFNAGDVALSLGLGGGAEVLSSIVGAAFRNIAGKKPPTNLVDESGELTEAGRSAIKEANVTEEQLKSSLSKLRQDLNVPEQLRLQRAEKFGIDLKQSKLSRDFETQQRENILLSSAGPAGAEARAIEKESLDNIKKAQDKFLESLGESKNLSRAEKGALIKESVKELQDKERAAVGELYQVAEELSGGQSPINSARILDISEEQILQRPVSPEVEKTIERALAKFGIIGESPKKSGRFTTVVNDEGKTIKFKGDIEPLTIGNAEDFRKSLNQIVVNDDTGAVLNIIRGLDNQIEEALEISGAQAGDEAKAAAFRRAREAFRELKAKFSAKDVIDDLTAFKRGNIDTPKIQPSEAITSILRGEKKLENIKKLKRVLVGPNANAKSKLAFNMLKTEAVGDIFSKAVNLNEAGGINSISGKKLNSVIDSFGDDALKELLGAKQLRILKELQKTIGDATFQVPRAENTSRTAAEFFTRLGNAFNVIEAIPGARFATSFLKGGQEISRAGDISRNLKLLKSAKPSKTPADIAERNKILIRILAQLVGKESQQNESDL